ncbi:ATP-binding cassette domain-containing protein [Croceicoccus ponticola]|uniref:ATP-binding cassette domain-containing protein n=1 Tax=Croceicoccus ponticola TaxID=2217664 RepID=A0A437GVL4_9SPHN|nr:ATP-binding cassette domain-containing protein [Croceicoccus ponticola]RVQ65812.1 ATP-binding cassette domain-containing protein [Croceicoccus ponticola]
MSFDIAIEVPRGDRTVSVRIAPVTGITALFGPSGVGKTTVLDAVVGLVRPASGHVRIAGATLFDANTNLPPERRGCGYVFQDGRLFPHKSVRDNLLYGWKLAPPSRRFMDLAEATRFLGIADLLDRAPRTLSGGEAQRVAIGRALLSGPRALLMDEPLSSLDADRRDGIMRVIERIRDDLSLPILYVSHDRAEVDRLAAQVVELG